MQNTTYPVVEVFNSIQGEGINVGRQATFVRLSGCNLKCEWCDTNHDTYGTNMTLNDLVKQIAGYNNSLVVITGGEPTIHNLSPLIGNLILDAKSVCIETNGTNPIDLGYLCHVTCSPKSGNGFLIHADLKPAELKYVVDDKFVDECIPEAIRKEYSGRIWLQSESMRPEMYVKAYEMVMRDARLRVGIQLHKILGVD